MYLKRLLYSKHSKMIISVLLGIGLSTIFRKICNERNCLKFVAPNFDEIKGKTFKHNDECYQYQEKQAKCDDNKKKVSFA